jgi:hypothetical protein
MVVLVVALDDGVRPQTEEVRESECGGDKVEIGWRNDEMLWKGIAQEGEIKT